MCSGNDSGNTVMQKTSWCDNLFRQNISTLEIHCQLVLVVVYWDHILVGRGCREFDKSGLASIMKMAPFSLADQEHVNTVQVVDLVLENHQDTIHDLSIALEWFVKTIPNIVHVQLGYSSVCAWWVPRYMMEVHENWCLEVLLCFFSHLNEKQMGSLNQWWHCKTWFRHFTRNEF